MIVYTKRYNSIKIDEKEAMRYAGASAKADGLLPLLRECIAEAMPILSYKVCYLEMPRAQLLSAIGEGKDALSEKLSRCDSAVLFCATVGIELDRLIARYEAISPTKALLLGAIGAAGVESLCDRFCADVQLDAAGCGLHALPRFSPGYGRLPLSLQRDVFRLLDCPRKIGVSLNESLLMSPRKSVTAFIGLTDVAKA